MPGVSESVAEWASAVATLLAVLVALFGPAWERRRRSPSLYLEADPADELGPDAKVVFVPEPAGDSRVWLRLAVGNDGRSTAEGVRVVLVRVEASHPYPHQPPMRELKWADVPYDTVTLAPGDLRLVDLVHVATAEDADGTPRRGLVPGVMGYDADDEAHPGHRLWWDLAGGVYTFHLRLSARDVPAVRYVARCEIDSAVVHLRDLARQLAATTVTRR
jgi:hypothetical protein